MAEENIYSRFRVLAAPVARPGHCFLCSGISHPPFADTGISIDFEGAVIVCSACITEMYRQIGGVIVEDSVDEAELVQQAFSEGREAGIIETMEKFNAFLASSDAGISAGDSDSPADSSDGTSVSSAAEDSNGSGTAVSKNRKPARKSGKSADEGSSTSGEQGRDDVPSDSGNGDALPNLNF